jgi:hypothetical protein
MNMEYDTVQYKIRDLHQEADQRRLVREVQDDTFSSLAANLDKIRQQLVERYTRKPQLAAPVCTEVCCSPG